MWVRCLGILSVDMAAVIVLVGKGPQTGMYWVAGDCGVALCAVGNLQAAANSTSSTAHAPAVINSVCDKCDLFMRVFCAVEAGCSPACDRRMVVFLLDLLSAVPAVVRHRSLLACGVLVMWFVPLSLACSFCIQSAGRYLTSEPVIKQCTRCGDFRLSELPVVKTAVQPYCRM